MKIFRYEDVKALEVDGAPGVTIRWVINEKTGAPNFAMRVFEVRPGAATPYHRHWYEQEMFILEGTGLAVGADGRVLRWPVIPRIPGRDFFAIVDIVNNFDGSPECAIHCVGFGARHATRCRLVR